MNTDHQPDLSAQIDVLRVENLELSLRLEEAEEILEAIRAGSVDAVVVGDPEEPQVYTLRGADHPYRIFVETMKEGTVTLAGDRMILYCNQAFARMVASPIQKVIGTGIDRFVHAPDAERFAAFLAQPDGAKCELKLNGLDGSQIPVFLSVAPAQIDGVNALCLVVTDLTQQKRHEEIVASERLARSVLEQAAEAIVVCDETGRITHANAQAERLCGCSPLWLSFEKAFPLRLSGASGNETSLVQRILHEPERLAGAEATFRGGDHQNLYMLVSGAPLHDEAGRLLGAVVVLTDITDRRASEAERERLHTQVNVERARLAQLNETLEERVRDRTRQVHALSRSLALAEQRERRRLSRVLHDDLQQLLFGLEMQLKLLDLDLKNIQETQGRAAEERCRKVRHYAQRAIHVSRTLSIELNPPILDGEGLRTALLWLGSHMKERYGLDVHLQVSHDAEVRSSEERSLIVQLVRELLFNIIKHAGVDRCRVSASVDAGSLAIRVEDDGAGFDVEKVRANHDNRRSLGLFSVEERLRLLDGSLEIHSLPGSGTRMTILVPHSPKQDRRELTTASIGERYE